MHHSISDVWSLGIFIQELALIYPTLLSGKSLTLPQLPIQYADFAYWQRKYLQGEVLEAQHSYWKQQLQNFPPLQLVTDRPRVPSKKFSGLQQTLTIPQTLVEKLRALSQREGVTLFMTLLSAFYILLYRYSDREKVAVRSPILNRDAETEGLIGAFATPLILAADLSGEITFQELLIQAREITLSAYDRPNMPLHYNLLTEVLFNFAKEPVDTIALPDCTLKVKKGIGVLNVSGIHLFSYIAEIKGQEGLHWALGYNADLFETKTIEQLMESYLQILEASVNYPQQKISQFNLSQILETKLQKAKVQEQKQAIAIASTFTANPLVESLEFWMQQLTLPFTTEIAPFNQVFQQLLDPASLLSQNQEGVNVILVRFEDWLPSQESDRELEQHVHNFVLALKSKAISATIPYLVCLCPASPKFLPIHKTFFKQMEDWISSELDSLSNIYVLTSSELSATYPVSNYYDAYGDEQGRIPFTPAFFTALGTQIARKINALESLPYKVIVLDCDRTLWKGACGEDGVLGIEIAPPYRALQEFMVAQHEAGKVICLCSKNNPEDVEAVFEYHSQMPLQREHIVSQRIDWEPKSENLKSLAQELQLSLDSFIFIDDNPVECAEVKANCPEVLTLQLPQDPEKIPQFLQQIWAFDRVKITREDKQRTVLYRQNTQRESYRKQSLSLADFIAGLNLKVAIAAITLSQIARVAQLTQRTNQFNLTTRRRAEVEIQKLCQSGKFQCLTVEVSDRFGNYGLVGAIVFEVNSDSVKVDTFLLSCRALGRGVEHKMLAKLGGIALSSGVNNVDIPYIPTLKNQPALKFLDDVGKKFKQPFGDRFLFSFPAQLAANCTYNPSDAEPISSTHKNDFRFSARTTSKLPILERLANELYDAEQILKLIQASKRQARPNLKVDYVAPRTDTEQVLADILANVLELESVGVCDDFFELGGSSMLAIQFISQASKAVRVELPLSTLFEATTIAQLAQTIEVARQQGEVNVNTTTKITDLSAEAVLDSTIRPSAVFKPAIAPKAVFLTGATGFLGAFLLYELLQQTSANIYCLVRASNTELAKNKIQSNLERYSLWSESLNSRIFAIPGDLSQPLLGLSSNEFQKMANLIDVIYHNGATVNFIYPYEQLKAANVGGTQEVLRLASQVKVKPVHYVSTMGVFQSVEAGKKVIREDNELQNSAEVQGGYFQSKWVAEKLFAIARSRGIPACIYRPGPVTGHSKTGVWNTDDAMCRLLKSYIQLGKAPDLDRTTDMLPVDYLSQAIVHLSRQEESLGQTFHFSQQKPMHFSKFIDVMRSNGYQIQQIPYDEWLSLANATFASSQSSFLHPLLPMLQSYSKEKMQAVSQLRFDCQNTERGLTGTDIVIPPVEELLSIYFSYFNSSGFLAD